ncbi:unnamed protein product [Notodromas monacha]|uniref:Uncharacterized protein n=1 Tax=Notodromas monacha TaxID=399045 RepID=A0A7R9BMT6_9CRUS|nr:unnamed protein product [Notodromas monacha]CAG0918404.1 unnamed protein product [Notodromas monacha]
MFFETDLIRLGRSNQAPSKSGSRLAEDYGVEGHLAALRSPAQLAPASPPPQPPSTPSSPPMKLASIAAFSKVRGNKTAAPAVGADANGGKARHHQHNVDDVLNEDDEDGSPSRNKGHRSKKSKAKSKHRSRSSMRYADAEKPPRRASKLIGRSADSLSTLSGKIQLSMMNSGLLPLSRAEESRAISALTTKPVEMDAFPKYMEQRRRYPVLLKVEFVAEIGFSFLRERCGLFVRVYGDGSLFRLTCFLPPQTRHRRRNPVDCNAEKSDFLSLTATRAVGEGHSTRHGSKSENETKNQNPKIIPCRVSIIIHFSFAQRSSEVV